MFYKSIVSIALLFSLPAAFAGIPPKLEESTKNFNVVGFVFTESEGVLQIVFNRPILDWKTYQNFLLTGPCAALWLDKKDGWGAVKINRLEVVNQRQAQGFALIDAQKSCETLGKPKSAQGDNFLFKQSWVCIAGTCRARREGEKVSGDE